MDLLPYQADLAIGERGPLLGDVDEVAVYNYALPAARIRAHYDAGN